MNKACETPDGMATEERKKLNKEEFIKKANSKNPEDRILAAHAGYGLSNLIHDKSMAVRDAAIDAIHHNATKREKMHYVLQKKFGFGRDTHVSATHFYHTTIDGRRVIASGLRMQIIWQGMKLEVKTYPEEGMKNEYCILDKKAGAYMDQKTFERKYPAIVKNAEKWAGAVYDSFSEPEILRHKIK